MKPYEKVLQDAIFPELEKGRPNWDKPHTETVVCYVKKIIEKSKELNLDEDVLIIAAYAHDWGYARLFEKGKRLSLEDINKAKKVHMIIGADNIKNLLTSDEFDFLSNKQKRRVEHLVRVHDNLDILQDTDELVLMEADTLAGLDVKSVKPSFDAVSNARYMRSVYTKRYPLFITDYALDLFAKLFKQRQDYYRGLD
ncbi:HD domain-containing protein [Candidatus Woesebacteria bacterium]|nr:MAG: HD domain-containing protein [Candidatus Woesebacteria bacterium]